MYELCMNVWTVLVLLKKRTRTLNFYSAYLNVSFTGYLCNILYSICRTDLPHVADRIQRSCKESHISHEFHMLMQRPMALMKGERAFLTQHVKKCSRQELQKFIFCSVGPLEIRGTPLAWRPLCGNYSSTEQPRAGSKSYVSSVCGACIMCLTPWHPWERGVRTETQHSELYRK